MTDLMKKNRAVVTLSLVFIFFLSILAYTLLPEVFKLTIRSVIEVPICNSRVASKLGIQSETVRDYVVKSIQPGMTPNEVEETLRKIAPISILDTSIGSDGDTFVSIRVKLCNNPLGDVVLDIHYSEEGNVIDAVDDWSD